MGKRIEWIDIAKGIGMMLIIMGHLSLLPKVHLVVTIFHVPLFFFLSAMFLKPISMDNYRNLSIKKIKRLLKPFYIFGFLGGIVLCLLEKWNYQYSEDQLMMLAIGEIYNSTGICFTGALWFLPALFCNLILTSILIKYRGKIQIIMTLALFAIATVLGYYKIALPFNFDISLLMMPITLMVCKYKTWILNHYKTLSIYSIPFVALTLVTMKIVNNDRIDYYESSFGFTPITIACTIPCICCVIWLSKLIENRNDIIKNSLLYVGRNSIIFLCVHQLFVISIFNKFQILADSILYEVIQLAIVLIFCIIITELINRKMKFIVQ